jgi:hypothetical protein
MVSEFIGIVRCSWVSVNISNIPLIICQETGCLSSERKLGLLSHVMRQVNFSVVSKYHPVYV